MLLQFSRKFKNILQELNTNFEILKNIIIQINAIFEKRNFDIFLNFETLSSKIQQFDRFNIFYHALKMCQIDKAISKYFDNAFECFFNHF